MGSCAGSLCEKFVASGLNCQGRFQCKLGWRDAHWCISHRIPVRSGDKSLWIVDVTLGSLVSSSSPLPDRELDRAAYDH